MGKKKRKDLIDEKENLTNTDVGFGEMAIQQTITNCSTGSMVEGLSGADEG